MRTCSVRSFYPDYSMIRYPRNLGGRRRAARCLVVESSECLSSHWRCIRDWAAGPSDSAWREASACRGAVVGTPQWLTSPAGTGASGPSGGRRRGPWRPAAAAGRCGGWRARRAGSSTPPGACTGSTSAGTEGTSSTARQATDWRTSPWRCWLAASPPWAGPSYTPPGEGKVSGKGREEVLEEINARSGVIQSPVYNQDWQRPEETRYRGWSWIIHHFIVYLVEVDLADPLHGVLGGEGDEAEASVSVCLLVVHQHGVLNLEVISARHSFTYLVGNSPPQTLRSNPSLPPE